jgi:hypothetical protein
MTTTQSRPTEVVTDSAAAYPGVIDELLPGAFHDVEQYATTGWNRTTAGSSRGSGRCAASRTDDRADDRDRPRLRREPRRGHDGLGVYAPCGLRLAVI